MQEIIRPSRNVERVTARIPNQTLEGVHGNSQHLRLSRRMGRNVVNEYIFVRGFWNRISIRIIVLVVPRGKHQQRLAIRADRRGYGHTGNKVWKRSKPGIQRRQNGAFGAERSDSHSGWQQLALGLIWLRAKQWERTNNDKKQISAVRRQLLFPLGISNCRPSIRRSHGKRAWGNLHPE